jgi:hypothetical protein
VADFVGSALSSPHPLKSLANGLGAKFDQYAKNRPIPNVLDRGATAVAKQCRIVAEETEEPLFLFANFMDAHGGF